ncbi:adenylate/guanylate cyclase domain-containing protein [Variovorax dokdonensis]|uniref:Adenylate/guanylate cyclase domain-containing protein n=1 Tax=Variovorax dokdonensis TaxID=344883 RepID=A0ABT7N9J6_9BURK|nr:adenylate/guanylate cyclase domain-containing protein [Variovorax dokdonensis]MDM0044614.1 adenylate/guanylate cyclase domain-containing protein [Variovorax dokdonensis]
MAALLKRHWARILVTLLPVAAMAAFVVAPSRPMLDSLDFGIYDWRLRLTAPHTFDPRIVIVDIDDMSLQAVGQWPWGRDTMARLTHELMDRQKAAALGFDMVFPEEDRSSGLNSLRELADGPLSDNAALKAQLESLTPALDNDGNFARAMHHHRVALGYYLTQSGTPLTKGTLPQPQLKSTDFPAGRIYATQWNGFGGNIAPLAVAASAAGFINAYISSRSDGLLRLAPLLAYFGGEHGQDGYYESLGLAVYRLATATEQITPRFAPTNDKAPPLQALVLGSGPTATTVPVDQISRMLVPYRGAGGATGGSFQYVSAIDVLSGGLRPGDLSGKIVLVGTTAPGLQDLRATPMSATFPGVEVHANVISALLDRRFVSLPDYARGFELAVLLVAGLLLAFVMSALPLLRASMFFLLVFLAVIAFNTWLFLAQGLVLPLASALVTMLLAFGANMGWGYLVEARARRGLANLFGTYVPRPLVEKMLESPRNYSMRAESKELTVMFCDMRGFTRISEQLPPVALQSFLNELFSRLTEIISRHGGTVDKYMGDCVMAFWGAPVPSDDHATSAVAAALEMAEAVKHLRIADQDTEVNVGIGLNTGVMSVGDMGSLVRRSYTVVGDAVNLAARLESLGPAYGVAIVASEQTMQRSRGFESRPRAGSRPPAERDHLHPVGLEPRRGKGWASVNRPSCMK